MTQQPATRTRREKIGLVGKLVTAIVLTLVLPLVLAMVHVKDSRKSASYCASCHSEYYDTWTGEDNPHSLAHSHAEMSISCQTCHDRSVNESLAEITNYITGNYYYPFSESELSDETCLSCHGDMKRVSTLTNTKFTGAEYDFHNGHIEDLTCGTCHNMHRESMLACAECHDVDLEPGWVEPE